MIVLSSRRGLQLARLRHRTVPPAIPLAASEPTCSGNARRTGIDPLQTWAVPGLLKVEVLKPSVKVRNVKREDHALQLLCLFCLLAALAYL
jgi:hypothetical protein